MLDAEVVCAAWCRPPTLREPVVTPLLVSSCSRLEMGLAMLGADPEAARAGWWEVPAQKHGQGLRRHSLGRLLLPGSGSREQELQLSLFF